VGVVFVQDFDDSCFRESSKPVKQKRLHSKLMVTFTGHIVSLTCLSFSPSALMLTSGCAKGWLNIWSLQVSLDSTDSDFFIYWHIYHIS